MAKNGIAAGLAGRCEVQLAYAIGEAEPVSIMVDTFGTGKASEDSIINAIEEVFDLTPRGIIEALDLRKPIYLPTPAYGHFGREPKQGERGGTLFSWESTDRAAALQRHVGKLSAA